MNGSAANVLRRKTLASHITGLRLGGHFKANRTVPPHTGWRGATPDKRTPNPVTGHRRTTGVGTRGHDAITGIRRATGAHPVPGAKTSGGGVD